MEVSLQFTPLNFIILQFLLFSYLDFSQLQIVGLLIFYDINIELDRIIDWLAILQNTSKFRILEFTWIRREDRGKSHETSKVSFYHF